ncbi:hypothetical protein RJ002_25785 [Escherichia coli]|nr:hypothetical protein [Escherichia coli]MDS4177184.1 hypothetical protein [Escherichia coli]
MLLHNSSSATNIPLANFISHLNDDIVTRKVRLYRDGEGKNNIVQGVVIDRFSSDIYTLHTTGKPEKGVINRFSLTTKKRKAVALSFQKPTEFIGHQGIGFDPFEGGVITSAGNAFANKGWFVTYFKYNDFSFPYEMKIIKIFDRPYNTRVSTMPVLTLDAKYLIVRSKLNGRDLLRVYNSEEVNFRIESDLSSEQNIEWFIDAGLTNDNYVLQAITADNKYIYLLSGGGNRENKRIYIYTLKGELVRKFNNVTVGKKDSLNSGKEKHWEPEGLAIDRKSKSLVIMFALGDHKKRFAQLYYIPLDKLIEE